MIEQQRVLATSIPGPRSIELQQRKMAAVSAGVGTGLPIYVTAGEGGILRDVDDNQLIDFGSGIAVTNVGNRNPRVVEAVQRQMEDFTHTCFMVTPYEEYVEVCELLAELTPGDHDKRSALLSSGAEAVENAVKIARHATGRQAVAVFEHGYHGRTNLTMGMTAKNMPYKDGFGPFAPEVYRLPMAYPYRWPTGEKNCLDEAFEAFRSTVHAQIGEERCAAVVLEPIQGEGGFIVPPEGYIARVAEYCHDHGIVFIADEVQSGFCRTGDWFAMDHEGVAPDLITTAKGIAGGMPLAAVTGRAEIMDAVHPGGLGGTYGGNPVACAAGIASIESMREDDLNARARHIEELLVPRLQTIADRTGVVGEIRGRGAMLAVELVSDLDLKTPAPELTAAINKACHERGLVTLTCGTYGNVFRFLPPLTIGDDLLMEGADILEEAFAAALA
ncbi:4-aminobutyrate--2-oxoglutarate transaminase [Janibacter sp. GXQ6167]|uniref:4-aminobutyrate--2-oxoglutarate transaminase n=1 Tax=Janibacter sp. GXQ6167 TaxID=3240791 RepID=UPI00352542EA